MTRSFLGASLITLSCLALAAACGDDEGDDNNATGGTGGTSAAGAGGSGMAGSGMAGSGMAGSGTAGTSAAGTGGAGGSGMATAGTGGMAGSTNTGVVLDAGLGGGNGDDAGGPGGDDAGGGGTATNEFDAAYDVLTLRCGSCHGTPAIGSDRPAFAQNNIEAAFTVTEGASTRGGTIATRIIAEAVTNRDMPPACNGAALGTPNCLTQAQANTLQAWVAAGADR